MIKDIFTKKENQIMLLLVAVSIVFILFGFFLLDKNIREVEPRKIPTSIEEIVWEKYENKDFDFVIEYPEHFKMFSDKKNDFGPVINFYFDDGGNPLPFDNFVNQNQIAIYPEGLLTQYSDHQEYFEASTLTNSKGVEFDIREYKKQDGTTWAIQAIPKNVPESWLDFGFIWISSKLKNKEVVCFDGPEKIEIGYCNPLEGDQFYGEGEVDTEFIEVGRKVLDSFGF